MKRHVDHTIKHSFIQFKSKKSKLGGELDFKLTHCYFLPNQHSFFSFIAIFNDWFEFLIGQH